MKDLFIYHPSSGTLVALSDPVYIVSPDWISEDDMEEFSMGSASREFASVRGIRIDNYNMTNLFFGE